MAVRKNVPFDEILREFRKFYESIETFLRQDVGDHPEQGDLVLTARKMESIEPRLKKIYQFAVFGEDPDGAYMSIDGDIHLLGAYLRNPDEFLYSLGSNFAKAKYEKLDYLYGLYSARITLDGDNGCVEEPQPFLSVQDVALLGCLDERSVRNAISQGDIKSRKDGSATVIQNAEARRWLQDRRGYNPTIWLGKDMDGLDSVKTTSQFTNYLQTRRKEIAPSDSIEDFLSASISEFPTLDAAKLFGNEVHISAKDVQILEGGEFPWPISICYQFSVFYKVTDRSMTETVMKLFFPDQYQLLFSAD